MPRSTSNMLDLSELPAPQRREMRDFFQFLLSRRTADKNISSYRFGENRDTPRFLFVAFHSSWPAFSCRAPLFLIHPQQL